MIDPKDKPIYKAICQRIDELLTPGCALDVYWGLDQKGTPMNMPYNNGKRRIKFYSLHGAATVASAEVISRVFNVRDNPTNYAHMAHILAENYYKEANDAVAQCCQ